MVVVVVVPLLLWLLHPPLQPMLFRLQLQPPLLKSLPSLVRHRCRHRHWCTIAEAAEAAAVAVVIAVAAVAAVAAAAAITTAGDVTITILPVHRSC